MTFTNQVLKQPGVYQSLSADSIDVAADDVTLAQPGVDVPLGANGLPLDLYGIETKKTLLGRWYEDLQVYGPGLVTGAKNKGILATGKRFRLVADPRDPFIISDCGQDGIDLSNDGFYVRGAYITRLGVLAWDSTPHADGFDISGGGGTISQCMVELRPTPGFSGSAGAYIESDVRRIRDLYLNSFQVLGRDYNYAIQCNPAGKYGPPRKLKLFNCVLERGRFGWLNFGDNSGSTWRPKNMPSWLEVDMATCKFI